jgi:hypothetical protein
LCEIFEEFVNYCPDSDILKYPFVLKSLKYFRDEFINSGDKQLVSLAKLANKLYLYWRKIAYTEYLEKSREKFLDSNQSDEDSESSVEKKPRKIDKSLKKNDKVQSDTDEERTL